MVRTVNDTLNSVQHNCVFLKEFRIVLEFLKIGWFFLMRTKKQVKVKYRTHT